MVKSNNNKTTDHLGFEAELFKAADKLRGNMEPSDYKHVALGLIFLKYISDAFETRHAELLADDPKAAEDKDEYLADNIFWVPKDARWSHLQANAKRPEIGTLIDDAMRAIEKDNESLKGVLPKDYARSALNKVMLGELIDLISGIAMNESGDKSKDVLGRVYEYFLSQFAGAEGKRGGEFYTPRSVVQVLVQMLEPYQGRVYDPCCGSGGMFVQSEKFVLEHGGRLGDIAIYGQESNYTTWRLAKMNLAVRDMWLTGFDAPSMHTMYIDKPMRGHGLMQAIARVNRVFRDKPAGLIVDYIGIAQNLKSALAQYSKPDQDKTGIDEREAVAVLLEKVEIVRDMFFGFDYQTGLGGTPSERLAMMASAIEWILDKQQQWAAAEKTPEASR